MSKKRRSSQFKDSSQVIDIQEARKKRQEKRQKQQQRAAKQAEAAEKKPVRAAARARQRRRKIIVAAIALAFIAAIGMSIFNIVSLKAEQKEALEQQKQLQQEKEELQQQLENSSDPDYIEEEAREQLRLVDPGEKIYVVPSVGDTKEEEKTSESE